jgi:hypothetical protein
MGQFTPKLRADGYTVSVPASTATSSTVSVLTWPENAYVIGIYGRVKTAFAGVTGPYVSLGVTGDTERYMPNQSINVVGELMSGTKIAAKATGVRNFCARMDKETGKGSARDIIATFGLGSGTFAALTAGELEFVIVYVDIR